jgi:CRP/FNR family cyclic AMP-dependent transcriptional regulator
MPQRRTASLLELDPELGALLPAERRQAARQGLEVELLRVGAGPWNAERLAGASPDHMGLLLISGVVSREVIVADTVSTELLGPGDVLRPWAMDTSKPLLQSSVRWSALAESRMALLDRRVAAALGQFPEVTAVIVDRLNDRSHRLATTQAISQVNRVDRRLQALFWHLAERWGRVTSEGVVIGLTLSHRMLGQLVGARRPTVSVAIGELTKRDEVVRRPDGTWLLKGEPLAPPPAEAERIVPIRRAILGSEDRRGTPQAVD